MSNEQSVCVNLQDDPHEGLECSTLYNCCDCGGNECGCSYCWSCHACDVCLGKGE